MNRREFATAIGGASAIGSLIHVSQTRAAGATTPLHVNGLIMISFEDSKVLRLGLPKASGHKGSLTLVPDTGSPRVVSLNGRYDVESARIAVRPEYKLPELIRMQEIHGTGIRSRVQDCPTVVRIPYGAIQSIATVELSKDRYTFVRSDNGKEISTFRPRKVAETLRIELSSDAVLKLEGGKTVAMNSLKEAHVEYAPDAEPTQANIDAFAMHFPHYYDYLDRPANAQFQAVPKNLDGKPSAAPKVGNSFMPWWPYYMCFVVGV